MHYIFAYMHEYPFIMDKNNPVQDPILVIGWPSKVRNCVADSLYTIIITAQTFPEMLVNSQEEMTQKTYEQLSK